ncbi:MAG TPA: cytochrome c biogenesis protein ResB, partial [Anaerolineae bacterium]
MSSVPSPTTLPAMDALEQHDPWRDAWQTATHDVLLIALCLIVALAVVAGTLLPQTPTGGTADPLAYSQWQTQARSVAGILFDSASMLSLFNVSQAFWLRVVMAALMVVIALRLMDRVSRLWVARVRTGDLRDEVRIRVTSDAPAITQMAQLARNMHYRVTQSTPLEQGQDSIAVQWLGIDHSPIAEASTIVLHIGLLITLAGIMLNMVSGWDVARQQVDNESMSVLPNSKLGLQLISVNDAAQTASLRTQGTPQTLELAVGARGQLVWSAQTPLPCCLSMRLNELIPGYHVSAKDGTGKPLIITVSSYAEPTQDVLLTIRRDEPGRL